MTKSMQHRRQLSGPRRRAASAWFALSVVFALAVIAGSLAQAQTYQESTLFTFSSCSSDGCEANQSLLQDAAGNLYGTTERGGPNGSFGTVFKLDTSGNETVLYAFTGQADGGFPNPGLAMDKTGNLYGTTQTGGTASCNCGTVFKVSKGGKETVLHSSAAGTDGSWPLYAGLVMDAAGNFYGTTTGGGSSACGGSGCGTVFKVSTRGRETVLYRFKGGSDGEFPSAGLALDKEGALYGTTSDGGVGPCELGCGTVFRVSKKGKETILHRFNTSKGNDGADPLGGTVQDTNGNLYGTTVYGGAYGNGTAFEVTKRGKETVLYSFTGMNGDGVNPYSGLVRDRAGNLYGATYYGGINNNNCGIADGVGCGTIFKLDKNGKETVLYSFTGGTDGANPGFGNLLRNAHGNLYGATFGGQASSDCLVFKLTP
jgi:uncharacterized repeat protein (TIGR03803 family)